jgi:hypothetical protein
VLTFMLGVLGSTVFWVVYFFVSIIAVAYLLRRFGNESKIYMIITTGHHVTDVGPFDKYIWEATESPINSRDKTFIVFGILGWMLIWPIIVICILISKIIEVFISIASNGAIVGMRKIFTVLPRIEISSSKNGENEQ